MVPKPIYTWILTYIIDPSILAPIGAYGWSRLHGGYQRPGWLPAYLWIQILDLVQGVIFLALALSHRNNQWFRHLSQPFVFIGLLWVLFRTSEDTPRRRRLYLACLGIGLLAALIGVPINGLRWRNALFTTIQSLVFLGLGTHELQRLLAEEDAEVLSARPDFWLYTAMLIYGSATMIFSASSNYFLRTLPPHLLPLPWIVNGLILVFYQLFLAKVFLCRKPSSS